MTQTRPDPPGKLPDDLPSDRGASDQESSDRGASALPHGPDGPVVPAVDDADSAAAGASSGANLNRDGDLDPDLDLELDRDSGPDPDPDDMWHRLRDGDEAARIALYERHHDAMVRWFRVRLPSAAEADDCVSEVFVRALDGIARDLKPDRGVDRWLWGIAKHVWMAELKARQRVADRSIEEEETPGAKSVTGSGSAAWDADLGHAYGKSQAFAAIYTATDALSQTQRVVVSAHLDHTLAEMRPVKGAELAARLGWSRIRVDRELSRGLKKVRERVGLLAAARAVRSCSEAARVPALARLFVAEEAGAGLVPTRAEYRALGTHAKSCANCSAVARDAVLQRTWVLGPGLALAAARHGAEDEDERRRAAVAWWTGRPAATAEAASVAPAATPEFAASMTAAAPATADPAGRFGEIVRNVRPALDAVARPLVTTTRVVRDAVLQQLLRVPGVAPMMNTASRLAGENPMAVRVGGAVVALATAAALTLLAVSPESAHTPTARPSPGASAAPGGTGPGPAANPKADGPSPSSPTATDASGVPLPGDTSSPDGTSPPDGQDTTAALPGGVPAGTGSGSGAGSGSDARTGTGQSGAGTTPGTGGRTDSGPGPGTETGGPPVPAVWGFWMVRYADDPIGTTRELSPTPQRPDSHEPNWTYGIWRLGNPPAVKTVRVTHLEVGRHVVILPDSGAPGGIAHVAVSDYAANGVSCQPVRWWQEGADERIEVTCLDRTGTRADIPFTGLFLAGDRNGPYGQAGSRGYVYAGEPTAARQLPAAASRQNTGAVTRTGIGRYAVAVAADTESVQVSPIGTTARHCAVVALSGGTASVSCTTHTGAPADTAFTLSHTGRQSLLDDARVPHTVHLTVADAPGSAAPTVGGSWMSRPGTATVTRTATGRYTLRLSVGYMTSYAHLTATGGGYCTTVLRNDYGAKDDVLMYLACYTPTGAPADNGFRLDYVTASPHYP
ncbi:sigma-70 family RNA polymerase sigma factor [Embleya sp. NPDC008237]|uniref:sigma-70 family RNA polymerase sigma factor n=1 Tax=Embleya sp. NPDC008237 TaxID=3363978 RepID=UPI0036E47927